MIKYEGERAKTSIQQDYLGPSPIFNHHKFQWMFCITRGIYSHIQNEIHEHKFYSVGDYYITGHHTICMNAKMLIVLKHLGYGCAQIHGLIIFRWESQLTAFVLRLCMSSTYDCTQKQMESESCNSMNMFMEFWDFLDHLTVCMFIGKNVLLLFRGCTKEKRSMQQLSFRQWQTITCGIVMQDLVL